MEAFPLTSITSSRTAAADPRRAGSPGSQHRVSVHRFAPPMVHEMTPAEIDAQRRLVRASLLPRRV
jgi:hypothetical protein